MESEVIFSAKKLGIKFGVKLVRGAYMEQGTIFQICSDLIERQRAQEKGEKSPIHDNIEDTHKSYNAGVELLLTQVTDSSVLIATHNRESVELTIAKMMEKNIPLNHKNVYVGQLYGMCDHLSFGAGGLRTVSS